MGFEIHEAKAVLKEPLIEELKEPEEIGKTKKHEDEAAGVTIFAQQS